MPEYTPQQIDEFRLKAMINEMIYRDRMAYERRKYQEREWLLKPSRKEPKVKRDPRGSKKGVRRGPYKKHLETSK